MGMHRLISSKVQSENFNHSYWIVRALTGLLVPACVPLLLPWPQGLPHLPTVQDPMSAPVAISLCPSDTTEGMVFSSPQPCPARPWGNTSGKQECYHQHQAVNMKKVNHHPQVKAEFAVNQSLMANAQWEAACMCVYLSLALAWTWGRRHSWYQRNADYVYFFLFSLPFSKENTLAWVRLTLSHFPWCKWDAVLVLLFFVLGWVMQRRYFILPMSLL